MAPALATSSTARVGSSAGREAATSLAANADLSGAIDPLLLTTTRITTHLKDRLLTTASGFFFRRNDQVFLVTSRHVVLDPATDHQPDRLCIDLHVDAANMARSVAYSVPLYGRGTPLWRQAVDGGGSIDTAVIEIDQSALPAGAVYDAFTPTHLYAPRERIEVGAALLIIGFPLGFHDTLHHMPVVRNAALASSFGLRFQGQGFFLTDGRTHRGSSGAAVVRRSDPAEGQTPVPWQLLGIHSSRLDMATRDKDADEALGLNCAWYADVLLTLTSG
jgi:hypothetical protein